MEFAAPALAVADWRRRVFALYQSVRAESDPAAAHALWRAGRDDLLMHHPASPVPEDERAAYGGAPVGEYRPELRFDAVIDTEVKRDRWEFESATDGVIPFSLIGVLHLPAVGDLDVWWLESYGGGIFVPLKDALAGRSTYGGGRYLIDTVKGADLGMDGAQLILDFNHAYNPSCAYDPRWACPLAPPANRLPVAVRAGERAP